MNNIKPTTKYTKSGRISLAYQVFGTGVQKIVYIPGWVSNIDLMWDNPQLVSFFKGYPLVNGFTSNRATIPLLLMKTVTLPRNDWNLLHFII